MTAVEAKSAARPQASVADAPRRPRARDTRIPGRSTQSVAAPSRSQSPKPYPGSVRVTASAGRAHSAPGQMRLMSPHASQLPRECQAEAWHSIASSAVAAQDAAWHAVETVPFGASIARGEVAAIATHAVHPAATQPEPRRASVLHRGTCARARPGRGANAGALPRAAPGAPAPLHALRDAW